MSSKLCCVPCCCQRKGNSDEDVFLFAGVQVYVLDVAGLRADAVGVDSAANVLTLSNGNIQARRKK